MDKYKQTIPTPQTQFNVEKTMANVGSDKLKRRRDLYHANTSQRKLEKPILISDKSEFRKRKIKIGKGRHYIMIKVSVF